MKVLSCVSAGIDGGTTYWSKDEAPIEGFSLRFKLESCDQMILEVRVP